jgi:hypothetical protein
MQDDVKDLPDIEEIRRFALNPGDVLVVRYKQKLSVETIARISQQLREYLALPNKIVILDNDPEVDVITRDEKTSDAAGIAEAMRKAKENPGRVVGVAD